MEPVWFLFHILLYCHRVTVSASYYSEPSWWQLLQLDSTVNTVVSPITRSKLTQRQQVMVARQPTMLQVVVEALETASKECRLQFRNRQWNYNLPSNLSQPVFGPISQRGCRETAFLYAIISASLTQHIAKACSKHNLLYCSCDPTLTGPSGRGWEWSGCSDNIRYAYRFVKKFTSSAENGNDIRAIMNTHNNEAGGKYVSSLSNIKCLCHGVSASCTKKTCWRVSPDLHTIGDKLYAQFHTAVKVTPQNFENPLRRKRTRASNYLTTNVDGSEEKEIRKKDLIYFEETPNMCLERPDLIKNRRCNRTSLMTDRCDLMCCDGRYKTVREYKTQQCQCRFIFCCKVECETCTKLTETSFCV